MSMSYTCNPAVLNGHLKFRSYNYNSPYSNSQTMAYAAVEKMMTGSLLTPIKQHDLIIVQSPRLNVNAML